MRRFSKDGVMMVESQLRTRGHVAQGIEHQVPVLRVAGSIPAMLVMLKAAKTKCSGGFRVFGLGAIGCLNS
jgi:hypothetical protein